MLGGFFTKHIFCIFAYMKKCRVCNKEKEVIEFESIRKGKTSNRCKSCKNEYTRKRYLESKKDPKFLEKERVRCREKYHRLGQKKKSKESNKKCHKNWSSKFPEKKKASISSRGIELINKENHRHHWSYNEEHYKDVIELSVKDHNLIHRFLKYDKESFYYMTLDGILLDTKEKHLEYIKNFNINLKTLKHYERISRDTE